VDTLLREIKTRGDVSLLAEHFPEAQSKAG
jgi:hypothetical protein